MAATFETSQHKGSDVVHDVCCSICEDDGKHIEGPYYCQKCLKYFCDSCVLTHNKFLKDHSVTAKGGGGNWPVTNTVDDTLALCDEHATEKLTMFCEDHEKLLCQLCLFHNHRQCSHVVLLAEKCRSSTNPIDVAEMASNMERLQKRLVEAVKKSEQNIKSLQTSYEIILKEILDFRRQINDSLDRLQQNTVNELDKLHSNLKNSLEDERKQCDSFISKLKVHDTKSITSPDISFILCRKHLDQIASAELFLQKAPTADFEFQHNNDLEQFLAACTDLGKITSRFAVVSHQLDDPNKVIIVKEKSQYRVISNTDSDSCTITGICEMSNGNIVISDCLNDCVKLLDKAYTVIDQVELPSSAWSICNISPNEVAVTVSDRGSLNEIHFLRVDTGKIIKINNLNLNHSCYGIAHHKGDLFITSGHALLQYTTDGQLMKKLYEDKSANYSAGFEARTSTSTGGLFGQQSQMGLATGGLFGQSKPVGFFNTATTTAAQTGFSGFGKSTGTGTGGMFGNTAQKPLFGTTTTQATGLFGTGTGTTGFVQPYASTGFEGFGTSTPATGGLFGSKPAFGTQTTASTSFGVGSGSMTDPTGFGAISGVAVSPDGKRIYVTDTTIGRLVTLTRDGAVTATLQDYAFENDSITCNIHVAATGQVFVFGSTCTYISQVDTDGKTKLAMVDVDGWPSSVYFNVDNSTLLVGMWDNDSMTEFKTTIS